MLLGAAGCNAIFGLSEPLPYGEGDGAASATSSDGGDGPAGAGGGNGGSSSSNGGEASSPGSGGGNPTATSGQGGGGSGGGDGGGNGTGGAGQGGGSTDCKTAQADPVTGQKCPLFSSCSAASDCGENVGCQLWSCNGTCELTALSDCEMEEFDNGCSADVVVRHRYNGPVDKDFLAPDNVDFREVATMALTIYNYTVDDLYLDKIPVELETIGGSKFHIDALKLFEDLGGAEHQIGDMFICTTIDYPTDDILGACGGSTFSKIPKGGSEKFLINIAWAKDKTFIGGYSYRLNIVSNMGWNFRVGSTSGQDFAGSVCGVINGGYDGAWLHAIAP